MLSKDIYNYGELPEKDLFKVGVIISPHALRGDVRVFPTTDDPRRFKKNLELLLDTGKELIKVKVERVRFHKQFAIIKFEGLDTIEDVERYRKKDLFVTREQAVPLRKNEYFIADLIGIKVFNEDDSDLGIIKDVIITGANDVYAIELKDGTELLIPAIRECILNVDMEAGTMKVHLLPGLMD